MMADDGRRTADDGRRTADDGRRTADNGPQTADDGSWSAVGGRRSAVGGRRSAVGGRQSAVGGRRSAVGGRQSAVGGRRSAVGGRRSAVGSRRLAVGGRQSAVGSRRSAVGGRLPLDFRLTVIGAVVLLLLIGLAQWLWFLQPVRFLLGLAYVVAVPGYWLTAALFPGTDQINSIERLALSLGLSVAWIAVLALILDALPWGLRLWPIVGSELASMLVFMAIALWRRGRLPAAEAYVPDLAWRPRPWWRSLPRFEKRIYGLVAAALVVAGLVAAQVLLVPSPADFLTEFYMLGAEGLAESYPREAAVGEQIGVTLGIRNLERGARAYRVEVWAVDPSTADEPTGSRRELVAQDGPYTLEKGDGREWPITWRMPWAGDDQVVELLLFTGDGTEPYRSLRLWLNVKK